VPDTLDKSTKNGENLSFQATEGGESSLSHAAQNAERPLPQKPQDDISSPAQTTQDDETSLPQANQSGVNSPPQAVKNGGISLFQKTSGSIVFDKKASGLYARYFKYITTENGTLKREQINLGKVIDPELGIFKNKSRGYFSFSLENGFGEAAAPLPTVNMIPQHAILDFGDVWMVDQIFKQTGLDVVMDNLLPEERDILKSLVSFRVLEHQAYSYAAIWYSKSYAQILYPDAKLDSSTISEFHKKIGEESIYYNFFTSYLSLIFNNSDINSQISLPILIDSTDLPNNIKTSLITISNNNDIINNEMRLIYVVDKNTKLPIFFRYIDGNIIDNSTLINTVNILSSYKLNIELIIIDAGYYSNNNLKQLVAYNMSFIIKMTKNSLEYNDLMKKHGADLKIAENGITYGVRSLYGKKVPVKLFGKELYAYIMLDINKAAEDESKFIQKHVNDVNKCIDADDILASLGKFILLSSNNYEISEILPLYYSKQQIEQVFDVSKNYDSLLTLKAHNEETIRGILLISFIAGIIYSSINFKLFKSEYCSNSVIYVMHRLSIEIYKTAKIINDITKDQREIFNLLNLECPFTIENETH
jgi:hypothetical protein